MNINDGIKRPIPHDLNMAQWVMVVGLFFYNRIEIITTIIACFVIYNWKRKILKSKILKYMLLIFLLSLFSVFICNYTCGKTLQQMSFIAVVYLLNEQFFLFNKGFLKELFVKFIKVSYFVCVLGLVQFFVWLVAKVDISTFLDFQWLTGMPGMHVENGPFIRVRSVNLEGGCLGEQLIPSLVYIFYYNDYLHIFHKTWKKYVILACSLFTISPFVYIALACIVYLKTVKKVPRFKYAAYLLGLFLIMAGLSSLQKLNLNSQDDIKGIDGIVLRLKDTIDRVEHLDSKDAALEANVSTAVLMTNLYSALNAPSRLIGTGIGTNSQNYARSFGDYTEDESAAIGLNTDDAYSLSIRVFSEMGFIGLALLFFFIYKNFRKDNPLNVCMFFMILPFLLRGGIYVGFGTTFMFFFLYYSSKMKALPKI